MSNKRTAEVAALKDEDEPRESDTTPVIPINLIYHLILPFLPDRTTWNAVSSANKELYEAGMRTTPPWPTWPVTKLELWNSVLALKFSPCGSFLAAGSCLRPYWVHIYDRHGRKTFLRGHTSTILLLSFSNEGNYLASTGSSCDDKSIRIWPTDSTTKLPQQSDKTLRGHQCGIDCLDFSPSDSNLLASGASRAIKLWNVEQEVCIYSFDHSCMNIPSLYFPVQDEGHTSCIFVTLFGSLIRTCWNDPSDIESDIVDMPGLDRVGASAFSHCGSLLAAASFGRRTVTLYDMRTMTVIRKLSFSPNMSLGHYNCLAFSPDDKTLVVYINHHEIHIYEVPDLKIRILLHPHVPVTMALGAVAFDPSGQFLASARGDENVRLWTL
jgi:WD40 repeat protein